MQTHTFPVSIHKIYDAVFFICQSHLALINEKTFNVHFHLMTMIKIVSYMPVE